MKRKTMKKLLILLLPLIFATSCKTLAKRDNADAIKKIEIPAPPPAKDENGNAYIVYDATTGKFLVDEIYIRAIIKYQFEVEAVAQALEHLKE